METLEVFREKEKKKNRNCEEMEWNHSGFGVTPRDGGGGTYKSIEREKEKKKNFFHYLEISNGVGGVHCMRWTLTNVGDLWIRRLRVAVNFSAAKYINGKKKRRNRNTGFLRSDISQTCLSLRSTRFGVLSIFYFLLLHLSWKIILICRKSLF